VRTGGGRALSISLLQEIFEIKNHRPPVPLSEVCVTRFALTLVQKKFGIQKICLDRQRQTAKTQPTVALIPVLLLPIEAEFDTLCPTSGTTPKGVWQPATERQGALNQKRVFLVRCAARNR
jgi:hypothetical protein